MNPLRSACEIAALVAKGELSAVDVVTEHIRQIERLDSALNAFVDVRADQALAEARAQDEGAARSLPRGPLGGVPVTIKSAIDVAGVRCETGSPTRRGLISDSDAVVVSRLRKAGAIVLGTTNVAEMLMAYESDNPLHGRTANPWAVDRTPGGSSGGESAAIAAACSAGGIGSDGGGSIRVPAHFTGICGLKPTPGRIPGTGHQPACFGPFSVIGVVGPMARTVADVEAMFRVLAGWDEGDPMSAPVAVTTGPTGPTGPAGPAGRTTSIRVGFFEEDGRTPVTAETRAAVRAAAEAAARAGYIVEEFCPPGLNRARELWEIFFCEAALLILGDESANLPILDEYVRRRRRQHLSALDLTLSWIERDTLRAQFLREMATHQILICPVASIPAFRHGERQWAIDGRDVSYLDAMSYTQWFNILGNPAAVVPVGASPEGLPIGVQIVGRPFEEELVLTVAGSIERECGGFQLLSALTAYR